MNTSAIAQMISDDPTIPNDIPGFVNAMNDKTISVVIEQQVVTKEAVFGLTSIAERNGGPCTPEDVNAAIEYLNSLPLLEQAKANYDSIVAAIQTGDPAIIDAAVTDADAAFSDVQAAQPVITPSTQGPLS